MRSSLIEKERPHCLAMTANTCFSRLCRLPCHITSVGSESHATNPVALLRCTTMQVLGFVDTRDFAVHPTSENLGVVCRWEVRPLLPHRKKARAMLPDCSMEREWKVSAGAVIHRWAGNGLSWSSADYPVSVEGGKKKPFGSVQASGADNGINGSQIEVRSN